jgi:prepilin-type processing-associated H-X9-DG protein
MLRPLSRIDLPPCRTRTGVTLLQLLVVLVVLLLLLGLLIPAIQKVRDAANRMASSNNLKQMMIAAHLAHDTYRFLPPSAGKYANNDGTLFFHLLPYIEQDAVYRNKITNVAIRTYQAAADPTNSPGAPLTSYASNFSVFGDGTAGMTLAIIGNRKGTANTLTLMERYAVVGGKERHPWGDTKPGATYLEGVKSSVEPGSPDEVKNTTAHCLSPVGCQVAFCDGSVRRLSPDIKPAVFQWACDPTTVKPAPGEF